MTRYSIVVPTRNRPETLESCIKTCMAQHYEHMELIVSDNSDSSHSHSVRQIVESTGSSQIRYVKPNSNLAMTDSWEFALGHARGKYVIFLGDDDGLAHHALPELDKLFELSAAPVVSWMPAYYYWPNMPEDRANRINIPLIQKIGWASGRQVIKRVIKFRSSYDALPMLYNSAVERELIESIKTTKGRFFFSEYPDIYSGFAVAERAARYLKTDIPFSIAGTSAKASGFAYLFDGDPSVAEDFRSLNRSANILGHRNSPQGSLLPACISSSFNWARDNLFPNDLLLKMSEDDLAGACLDALGGLSDGRAAIELDTLSQFFGKNKAVLSRMRKYVIAKVNPPDDGVDRPKLAIPKTKFDESGERLLLDGSRFGISNIFDCANLIENLLGYRANGIDWDSLLRNDSLRKRIRNRVG
jgi:hypothetical protein